MPAARHAYIVLSFSAMLSVVGPAAAQLVPAEAPGVERVTSARQLSIFFAGGSAYVYPEEAARLHAFLDSIPALGNYGVELQGHTDDIGDVEYNLRLSAARTRAVRQQLIDFGIDAGGIEQLPLGEESPYFDNATWEGKLSNRRVDVILRPML